MNGAGQAALVIVTLSLLGCSRDEHSVVIPPARDMPEAKFVGVWKSQIVRPRPGSTDDKAIVGTSYEVQLDLAAPAQDRNGPAHLVGTYTTRIHLKKNVAGYVLRHIAEGDTVDTIPLRGITVNGLVARTTESVNILGTRFVITLRIDEQDPDLAYFSIGNIVENVPMRQLFSPSRCNESVVGKWRDDATSAHEIEFRADGTLLETALLKNNRGTYTLLDGGRMKTEVPGVFSGTNIVTWKCAIHDDKLTMMVETGTGSAFTGTRVMDANAAEEPSGGGSGR